MSESTFPINKEELKYFLSHLYGLSKQVENIVSQLESLSKILQNVEPQPNLLEIWTGLMELTIIKYDSFVKEFHKYKSLIADTEFHKATTKVLSVINKEFPEIEDYRN